MLSSLAWAGAAGGVAVAFVAGAGVATVLLWHHSTWSVMVAKGGGDELSWPAGSQEFVGAIASTVASWMGGSAMAGGAVPRLKADAIRVATGVVDRSFLVRHAICTERPAPGMAGAANAMPLGAPHAAFFGMQLGLLTDPRLPFSLIGSVHYACKMYQTRPIRADAPLRVQATLGGIARPHRRGTLVDVVLSVWEGTDSPAGPERLAVTNTFLFFHSRRGFVGDELSGGSRGTPDSEERLLTLSLEPSDAAAWASLTGDFNPIHTSDLAARALGVGPVRIVHGMSALDRALPAVFSRAMGSASGAAAPDASGVTGALPEALLPAVLEAKFTRPLGVPAARVVTSACSPAAPWAARGGVAPGLYLRVSDADKPDARPFQEACLVWGKDAAVRAASPVP